LSPIISGSKRTAPQNKVCALQLPSCVLTFDSVLVQFMHLDDEGDGANGAQQQDVRKWLMRISLLMGV